MCTAVFITVVSLVWQEFRSSWITSSTWTSSQFGSVLSTALPWRTSAMMWRISGPSTRSLEPCRTLKSSWLKCTTKVCAFKPPVFYRDVDGWEKRWWIITRFVFWGVAGVALWQGARLWLVLISLCFHQVWSWSWISFPIIPATDTSGSTWAGLEILTMRITTSGPTAM